MLAPLAHHLSAAFLSLDEDVANRASLYGRRINSPVRTRRLHRRRTAPQKVLEKVPPTGAAAGVVAPRRPFAFGALRPPLRRRHRCGAGADVGRGGNGRSEDERVVALAIRMPLTLTH